MTGAEVWGDPIDHSLSPTLHRAAYAQLGWDWTYERRRVSEAAFAGQLAVREPAVRGLSLTYPLKASAWGAAATRDERAELTGALNTLEFSSGAPRGFNTDVGGIVADLSEHDFAGIRSARIIGSGATATSALVALAEMGVGEVDVVSRREPRALIDLAPRLGLHVSDRRFDDADLAAVDLTIATLPGGAELPGSAADSLAVAGGTLYDVVYGHWPTALAGAWQQRGGLAIAGIGMLLHQAVLQIRVFATGDVDAPLPDEAAVVASMRRALMGD